MTAVRLWRFSHEDGDALDCLLAPGEGDEQHGASPPKLPRGLTPPTHLERAETLYRQRQARHRAFPGQSRLFREPAWDMLLDLFIAREKGQTISVTSACGGANVASTTGLRWLGNLERQSLVRCWRDGADNRRRLVELTPEAEAAMRSYLETI
ncbi:MAG TPA: MarR family winged helix-turn-helix transcriptional regulator [Sphingomonas sp.]|jgi:hypothetical protein|uniref:MarR family winged helix-turn-helix transcriptional regulator n=1 Tax=Sphingomonas sp. TaxID=28214 RepID=UPI002EDA6BBE